MSTKIYGKGKRTVGGVPITSAHIKAEQGYWRWIIRTAKATHVDGGNYLTEQQARTGMDAALDPVVSAPESSGVIHPRLTIEPMTDEELAAVERGDNWRKVKCCRCGGSFVVAKELLIFECLCTTMDTLPSVSLNPDAAIQRQKTDYQKTQTGPLATERLVAEVRRLRAELAELDEYLAELDEYEAELEQCGELERLREESAHHKSEWDAAVRDMRKAMDERDELRGKLYLQRSDAWLERAERDLEAEARQEGVRWAHAQHVSHTKEHVSQEDFERHVLRMVPSAYADATVAAARFRAFGKTLLAILRRHRDGKA